MEKRRPELHGGYIANGEAQRYDDSVRERFTAGLLIASLAAAPLYALPKRRAVRPTLPVCATMTSSNLFIHYYGPASICNPVSFQPCNIGEGVEFALLSFAYDFSCDAHSVTWDFGDGSPRVSGEPKGRVTHAYAQPGTYIVIATVANHSQSLYVGTRVFVGGPVP